MSEKEKVIGYTPLTDEQVALMNECKEHGIQLAKLIDKLRKNEYDYDTNRWGDQRWIDIGETQLQQGIMALVRQIAKPTTF